MIDGSKGLSGDGVSAAGQTSRNESSEVIPSRT